MPIPTWRTAGGSRTATSPPSATPTREPSANGTSTVLSIWVKSTAAAEIRANLDHAVNWNYRRRGQQIRQHGKQHGATAESEGRRHEGGEKAQQYYAGSGRQAEACVERLNPHPMRQAPSVEEAPTIPPPRAHGSDCRNTGSFPATPRSSPRIRRAGIRGPLLELRTRSTRIAKVATAAAGSKRPAGISGTHCGNSPDNPIRFRLPGACARFTGLK